MSTGKTAKFKKKIWDFYNKNKRDFPWRNTTDPYKILVSELMLQQTQTSRVLPKYEEFLKKFPTLQKLAKVSNEDVLRIWSGLGYNRRALYLKRIAETVTGNYKNKIPLDPKILESFPGIGKNTAGAVYVFSTNKPYVFIETNIRRVFIHEFFENREKINDKELLILIEETMDTTHPREWYYALMDYGVHVSKIETNPNRRSKHYIAQSKFEGSSRQIRGKILKILLSKRTYSVSKLETEVNSHHFKKALHQLVNEQFIKITKEGKISLLK